VKSLVGVRHFRVSPERCIDCHAVGPVPAVVCPGRQAAPARRRRYFRFFVDFPRDSSPPSPSLAAGDHSPGRWWLTLKASDRVEARNRSREREDAARREVRSCMTIRYVTIPRNVNIVLGQC